MEYALAIMDRKNNKPWIWICSIDSNGQHYGVTAMRSAKSWKTERGALAARDRIADLYTRGFVEVFQINKRSLSYTL